MPGPYAISRSSAPAGAASQPAARPAAALLTAVLLTAVLLTGAAVALGPGPARAAEADTVPLSRETQENRAGFPAASRPDVARQDGDGKDGERTGGDAKDATRDAASDQPDALSGSVPPEHVAGTYRLRSVNDQPLPTLIGTWEEKGRTCREHVLSGAIQLKPDRTYQVRTLTRTDCGGRDVKEREQEGERGTWRLSGNALYLDEDARAEPGTGGRGDRELTGGIPVENLGGTGQFADGLLTIGLENGKAVATFQATDGRPGPG